MPGPVLEDFRGVIKLSLPSYPNSEVEIYDGILVKDYGIFTKFGKNAEDPALIVEVLKTLIKSWNFTNAAGDPLPVTSDTLAMLKIEDLIYITTEITEVVTGKKKDTDI